MVSNSATNKYVKSLYDVTISSANERSVAKELSLVKECILCMKDHKIFLKRISLLKDEGERFFKFLSENFELSDSVCNFLGLLLRNKRFDAIVDIADAYSAHLDKLDGKKVFYITFAREVSKDIVESLRCELEEMFGGKIEYIVEKDESLIDGVRLQHNSRILDYSLQSQLRRLSRAINGHDMNE